MGDLKSYAQLFHEFNELRRVMFELRCEAMRAKNSRLFYDVTSELDRISADIQAAGKPGRDPWKTAQDAKRRIAVVQKDIVAKTFATKQGHGDEAGTRIERIK